MVALKRTFRKDILRQIRGTFSRFFAIFAIVALGVGFLAGLLATTPDMRLSVDRYYDETHMMDIRVLSTMGLTDGDLDEIRKIDGVEAVMPAYSADMLVNMKSDDTAVTRLHSLPFNDLQGENSLNRVVLLEGRLPQAAGECVMESEKMLGSSLSIGDTLRLSDENENLTDTLAAGELTIVGKVRSAYYFSIEKESSSIGKGAVDLFLYTVPETFRLDVYTDIFVTVGGARELTAFSDTYDDAVQPVMDRLEALGEKRVVVRRDEIVGEATGELADAQKEYDEKKQEAEEQLADAQQKLIDARDEIEKAERELADGRKELEDGEHQAADAEKTLADALSQIEDGEKALADGRKQFARDKAAAEKELAAKEQELAAVRKELDSSAGKLSAFKAQLDEGKQKIDQAKAMIGALTAAGKTEEAAALAAQLEPQEKEYNKKLELYTQQSAEFTTAEEQWSEGKAQLEAGRKTAEAELAAAQARLDESEKMLAASRAEWQRGKAELEENQRTLADARAELSSGERELADAKGKLADGEKEYADSKREADEKLSDARKKLDDAEQQIADIETPEWFVLNRHANVSYVSFEGNAEKVEAIAKVFPIFFFLVAALVALTTMTRMIEEQRTQIGTMKALGYSKGSIAFKYLLYAGSATITGSICGLLIGFKVFPTVIWGAYEIMYTLPPLLAPFNVKYALISSIAAIVCTLLATFAACYGTLIEAPARLMLPRAPKPGKRVFLERIKPLWSRLKFTHKVTVRNLIRYKKRFFMTVFGIAGCTALLLTGFGLRDSISDIVGKQFNEIAQYNTIIQFKNQEAAVGADMQSILGDGRFTGYLSVHQANADVTVGNKTQSATLYVPQEAEKLKQFITLRERRSGRDVPFKEDRVVVTEKMAEKLGVKEGSVIQVKDADNRTAQFTVGGITENYVYSYVYIPPALYAQAFGGEPEYLTMIATLADTSRGNRDALTETLLEYDDISSVQFTTDLSEQFSDVIKNIDYIVVVLIISAGLLAFVVLYNLTNINITERQREIATIKVLGFFDREVSAYVYRETALLSLIGTAAGLILGIFLHAFVVKTAEVDIVMFGRSIKPLSFVLAAVMTLVFSVLVNLVMHRKLKKIDMVESMKSGE